MSISRGETLKEISVNDPNIEFFQLVDGINNPREIYGAKETFKVEGKDGAMYQVEGYAIAYPLEGSSLNSNSDKVMAQLVLVVGDDPPQKGVLLHIPQDHSGYHDDSVFISSAAQVDCFSDQPDKMQGAAAETLCEGMDKIFAANALIESKGGAYKKVIIIPPTTHVSGYASDEEGDEDNLIVSYGNSFFNTTHSGEVPRDSALRCGFAHNNTKFKMGSTTHTKLTGYSVLVLSLDGSEVELRPGEEPSADEVNVDQIMKKREEAAMKLKKARSNKSVWC